MVSHHLEIERKYEIADPLAPLPQLDWSFKKLVAAPPVKEHLDATYFDTAAKDLGRHKIALRRRLGGYDQGWHIKFDAAGNRHEVGYDLLEKTTDIPVQVERFVRLATCGAPLLPAVALVTDRVRTVLSAPGVGEVAEICEDAVKATDHGTGIERSWCEWEVELLGAAEEDAELAQKIFTEVEKVLFAAGAVVSVSSAKIARALGKDADFEARRALAESPEKKPKKKAPKKKKSRVAALPGLPGSAQLLTDTVRSQAVELVQAELLLRCGVPDATHRGRIAARQLRSTLKYMVRPYAKSAEADAELSRLGKELRFYAAELEQNRNGELMADIVAELEPNEWASAGFLKTLASLALEEQNLGKEKALTYLDSPRRLALQEGLAGLIEDVTVLAELPLNSENYLNKVAKRLRKNLVKTYETATLGEETEGSGSSMTDESLHDVRKMAKAVRYVLSACQSAGVPLTEDQQELLGKARDLQSTLGQITDELTFTDWLAESRDRAGEGSEVALGYLLGYGSAQAEGLRQEAFAQLPAELKKIKKLPLR